MIRITKVLAIIGLALWAVTGLAQAQATRTWVSGVGDDANPCSRTAPCKTFAGAISKTAAGGEINALDPGGFGAVTITKSITISSEGFEAGILASGTNGVIINAASTDRVVIRGLDFDGFGTGLSGIKVLKAANVLIEDCTINNFNSHGVEVNSVDAQVVVMVKDSRLSRNRNGITVTPGASFVNRVLVDNSLIFDTTEVALKPDTAKADIVLNRSVISGSLVKDVDATNGATVNSYGNNVMRGAGNPTGLLALE